MTFIAYEEWNAKPESLTRVDQANTIIEEYEADGYTLTLRQLYYQFVSRGMIGNNMRAYKSLTNLITKARMAGIISWHSIEDRTRAHVLPYVQEDERELIDDLPRYIQFDRWAQQSNYVEVWVEKEALGNVIERACDPYMVPYMACKGYLSASASWRAGQRFKEMDDLGKACYLIHLGDHDPSGIDMTRDNRERLDIFTGNLGAVAVNRIALNMDQVEEYEPPPNPAKETDSRSGDYKMLYGSESWELDALEPRVIEKIIQDEIKELIDPDAWREVGKKEKQVRELLANLGKEWESVKQNLEDIYG